MAHAAAWLAYAVGKSDPAYNGYLGDAKNYFKAGVPWSMSWSEKRPAVGVSLNFFVFSLTRRLRVSGDPKTTMFVLSIPEWLGVGWRIL